MQNKFSSKSGFSVIEVMIWVFIFTLGLISIYMLISSSISMNYESKNKVIASNLARECIELTRNIRDSNYNSNHSWDQINPNGDISDKFSTWSYYTIENNYFNYASFPIEVKVISDFWEWSSELNWKMQNYRLYLDPENRYTYNIWWTNEKTHFYRYLWVDDVKYNSGWDIIIDDALKITCRVYWLQNGLHKTDIKTIITDFKRN